MDTAAPITKRYKTEDFSLDNDLVSFQTLKKKINENLLFNHNYYNDNFIKRRIEVRMRHLGIKTFKEYINYLDQNLSEYISLNKELTINVTEFFRDADVFQNIRKVLFPAIIKKKIEAKDNNITICSIGCSTGEEPYSVAMIIHEILGEDISNFNIKIFAIDYDNIVLTKAKIGEYSEIQLKNLPEEFKKKYFDKIVTKTDTFYHIHDMIKNMVTFKQSDILSNVPSISNLIYDEADPFTIKHRDSFVFDLILCRNLVIYFNRVAKGIIYEKIYNSLSTEGYLILGKTEVILGEMQNMLKVVDVHKRVYQKAPK